MSMENQLAQKVLDFKIKMGNPSAWESYSEEGSEIIRELVAIVEGGQKIKDEKIYKENEEPSINDLFRGEIIESIEGNDFNISIKTVSGKELCINEDGAEGGRLSCVTEVNIWKPQTKLLSL